MKISRRLFCGASALCLVGLTLSCGAAASQPAAGQVVTLEFEPPPEFFEPAADGTTAITGFRIGYFRPEPDGAPDNRNPRPLRTVAIPREAVHVTGRLVRVSFTPDAMPAGSTQVVFRVQAMSGNVGGWWSEPTGAVTVPELPHTAASRGRPNLEEAVAGHPALLEAIRALEAKGARSQRAGNDKNPLYQAFRRVQDLAAAVVICRDHAVPCDVLAERMIGPPRRSMQRALREWKDVQAIPALVRSARSESQALLNTPARKK